LPKDFLGKLGTGAIESVVLIVVVEREVRLRRLDEIWGLTDTRFGASELTPARSCCTWYLTFGASYQKNFTYRFIGVFRTFTENGPLNDDLLCPSQASRCLTATYLSPFFPVFHIAPALVYTSLGIAALSVLWISGTALMALVY
jgi:hypothetical protein